MQLSSPSTINLAPTNPMCTYVCTKDSMRHRGVSERQGEAELQWSWAPSSAHKAGRGQQELGLGTLLVRWQQPHEWRDGRLELLARTKC